MATPNEAILTPRGVGEISEMFFVPAYQRGYRWGEDEVRRLLEDIWEKPGSAVLPAAGRRQGTR